MLFSNKQLLPHSTKVLTVVIYSTRNRSKSSEIVFRESSDMYNCYEHFCKEYIQVPAHTQTCVIVTLFTSNMSRYYYYGAKSLFYTLDSTINI